MALTRTQVNLLNALDSLDEELKSLGKALLFDIPDGKEGEKREFKDLTKSEMVEVVASAGTKDVSEARSLLKTIRSSLSLGGKTHIPGQ